MGDFNEKAALVTGAGSGIGRAIGLGLAAKGAYVWATDHDLAAAKGTVAMIEAAGGKGRAVRLDVSDEAQWQTTFELCDAGEQALTILVNCAGISAIADTFSMQLDDFRRIMAVNAEGTFLGMKHGVPRIAAAGGGSVINISSMAGLKGISGMAAYCASKGAIRMMSKAVALECASLRNHVRVNSLHPGLVDTPALRKHIDAAIMAGQVPQDTDPAAFHPDEIAKTAVPIGVACQAEEVADLVCFLSSANAAHITGAEIPIDGGMTAG